jgi:hypothetical protein
MKPVSCPRLWEVEASRDGRLSGEELARFKEHCERCEPCTARRDDLDGLIDVLGQSMPDGLDPLSLRRLRQRVLESADATLARPSGLPPKRAVSWSRAAVLVLSLGVCVFAGVHHIRSERAALPPSPSATRVVVEARGNTDWREHSSLRSRRFTLLAGTLRLSINRAPGDQPVVVEVPDGELEDEGTTFSVRVEHERTISIVVEAGAVLFRRRGGMTLHVHAGQSWTNTDGAETPPSSVAPPAETTPGFRETAARSSSVDPPRRVEHLNAASSVHRTAGATSARGLETATAAPATHGATGRDESGAVEAEEDLQYLRILALEREGRTREASLAAQEYLRRFPSGFRRVEAERIARRP